jgi:hypothetical protein
VSVPAGQMGQDPKRKQAEGDSHAAVHQGIQALAGAAAKMGGAATQPHPELMAALQSLHGKVDQLGQQGQDDGGADQYANMPDPSDWVENDPDGAANYAEAILAQLAHMLTNQAAAPAGAPMMDAGSAPPDVGGGAGPAY